MTFKNYNILDLGKATLDENINASETTFVVRDVENLPESNFITSIRTIVSGIVTENERIYVATRTGNIFSGVVRGYAGTSAKSFDENAEIQLNVVSEHIIDLQTEVARLESDKADVSALDGKANLLGGNTFDGDNIFGSILGSSFKPYTLNTGTQISHTINTYGYNGGVYQRFRSGTGSAGLQFSHYDTTHILQYKDSNGLKTVFNDDNVADVDNVNNVLLTSLLNNGNLGLGGTPLAKLHIYGNDEAGGVRFARADGTKGFNFWAGTGANIFDSIGQEIRFRLDGSDLMTLENDRIGAGVTAPSGKFHIRSNFDINGVPALRVESYNPQSTTAYFDNKVATSGIYDAVVRVIQDELSSAPAFKIENGGDGHGAYIRNETTSSGIACYIQNYGSADALKISGGGNKTIVIDDGTISGSTTNRLYASGGNLYWNGIQLN